MGDTTRYNAMEQTLQTINRDYVSLSQEEMAENNMVLNEVLQEIIKGCQDTSELFETMYRGLFYGGSYYDGLKIKRPDEYDIDIKFKIPYDGPIDPSNRNGYVNLRLEPLKNNDRKLWSRKHRCYRPYYGVPGMHVLANFDDNYLDTEKVMLWMHQVLSTSIKGKKVNKNRISYIDTESYGGIKVKFRRHGPAFTFRTSGFPDDRVICFDLVPCFVFGDKQWPSSGFRKNCIPEKSEFFIVPKPLPKADKGTRYWRLSFQEQERVMINSKDKLKPSLRLLKKMRDKFQHDIASYFIKNMFLWEVVERNPSFWKESLSYVFMEALKNYQRCIRNGEINYFWYIRQKFNLIAYINKNKLTQMSRKLESIITDLENNLEDEFLVAKYLLSRRELNEFRRSLQEDDI